MVATIKDMSNMNASLDDGNYINNILPSAVKPLKLSQPVAYRLLTRIQVQCPLQQHQCSWKGDYGDLQSHLLSSTSHNHLLETVIDNKDDNIENNDNENNGATLSIGRIIALAESFKEEGNAKFASKNFMEAHDLYSKGIDVFEMNKTIFSKKNNNDNKRQQSFSSPEIISLGTTLYANRAASLLQVEKFVSCLEDCQSAIELDSMYAKGYIRRNKAYLALGRFEEAVSGLEIGCRRCDISSGALMQKTLASTKLIRNSFKMGMERLENDAAAAKSIFTSLLRDIKPGPAPCVVLGAAKANLKLGITDIAQRLSLQLLRSDPQNFEAYMVQGHALCWSGGSSNNNNDKNDIDKGLMVLREGLRLDPDSKTGKILLRQCQQLQQELQKARKGFFHRRFVEAIETYGRILLHTNKNIPRQAPIYSIIHAERAEAHLRLRDYNNALKDTSLAIYYARDDASEQALLIKMKAYHGLGRHEDAKEELIHLLNQEQHKSSRTLREAYQRADFEVRKEKRPNFYELLGVSSIASLIEIKKQYKVKAMQYHPDKCVNSSKSNQKVAEEKFKLLGEALELLSNDFQRQLYDEGYDQDAIRERVAAAEQQHTAMVIIVVREITIREQVAAAEQAAHHHGRHNCHHRNHRH
eukprot:CAMPEP_0194156496 /NCGR_PEP_ID=MMETSP0152-20130528/68576_1 /TAXON_ID=1049557 /ORGANISM="Thalassiothrix antarctica, Strain L6-D1" /LENGTH=639 /DNA_ID=CAMNT_0038864207 /DNA_START=144 /DNA_END=2065 /DNA_ORIENTATION=-